MKFNFKVFLGSLTVILLMFTFTNFQPIFAQTPDPEAEMETVTMATVNIYDPTNKKTGANSYSINFELYNRVGIQPNIRYGIGLILVDSGEIVDLQLENTALTLGEDEGKYITLDYSIPSFISNGTYRIVIMAQNQNGLPLATRPIGYPEKYLVIDNSSKGLGFENCFLTVDGESSENIYSRIEGVAIRPEENLKATCEIVNEGSLGGDWKLQLITHKRSQFGDIVANNVLEQKVTVKRNSKETVSFYIPTQKDPQSYNVDTFLIDPNGNKVSSSVYLHYVMTGNSATIQNVLLNKTSYTTGEIAQVKFLWTASADGFPGSRLEGTEDFYTIKAEIIDENGNICGSASKGNISPEYLSNNLLEVSIEKDCLRPKVNLSVLSSDDIVLDSTSIDTSGADSDIQINANIPHSKMIDGNIVIYIIIFFTVLVLIAYGILRLRKREVDNKK